MRNYSPRRAERFGRCDQKFETLASRGNSRRSHARNASVSTTYSGRTGAEKALVELITQKNSLVRFVSRPNRRRLHLPVATHRAQGLVVRIQ